MGGPGGRVRSYEIRAPLLISALVLLRSSARESGSHFSIAAVRAKELLALFTLTGFL